MKNDTIEVNNIPTGNDNELTVPWPYTTGFVLLKPSTSRRSNNVVIWVLNMK